MRSSAVGAFIIAVAIVALAIGVAGCTQDDINDIVREEIEEEAKNQTIGRADQLIQDVQGFVDDLMGGSAGTGKGGEATVTPRPTPTEDPDATPTPKPIFPVSPTPVPLTDADQAIHITATLEVRVIDKDGNPIPNKMVWFNGVSWVQKDPNTIMLMKPADNNGRVSFTVGYDLIDNRERFSRLGSPNYVDYLAMAATTCNPLDPEGRDGTPMYIDIYATDHWKMITYQDASAQAGALKYAAMTRSLTLRLLPNNDQGFGPFQYVEYAS